MEEFQYGVNSIIDGIKYHSENFLRLRNFAISSNNINNREIINKMNNEVIAYFNRLGQFYYFVKSDFAIDLVGNYKDLLPNVCRLIIFRHKQSAHRATDQPNKNDPKAIFQLDKLFTYQYILVDKELFYQVLLDEEDYEPNKKSVNFQMSKDHPKVIFEIEDYLRILNVANINKNARI